VGPFNSATTTELAAIVCKVQVTAVRQKAVVNLNPDQIPNLPSGPTAVNVASVKRLSTLKGECPAEFEIEFQGEPGEAVTPRVAGGIAPFGFTQLVAGECCLVFLTQTDGGYALHSPHSGKLALVPRAVAYEPGASPLDKLLAELMITARYGEGEAQMRAIEEIGKWGVLMRQRLYNGGYSVRSDSLGKAESALRALLMQLRSSKDLTLRGLAMVASIQFGAAPTSDEALSLYNTSAPTEAIPNPIVGNSGSSLEEMQQKFIDALADSMISTLRYADGRGIPRSDGGFVRGVSGFDYAEFCRRAAELEPVKKSEQMRGGLSRIIWLLSH
jgi:hypothetical protein